MQLKQLGLLLPTAVHSTLQLLRSVKIIDKRALHRKYYRKKTKKAKRNQQM